MLCIIKVHFTSQMTILWLMTMQMFSTTMRVSYGAALRSDLLFRCGRDGAAEISDSWKRAKRCQREREWLETTAVSTNGWNATRAKRGHVLARVHQNQGCFNHNDRPRLRSARVLAPLAADPVASERYSSRSRKNLLKGCSGWRLTCVDLPPEALPMLLHLVFLTYNRYRDRASRFAILDVLRELDNWNPELFQKTFVPIVVREAEKIGKRSAATGYAFDR